jgi:glycosyltransferase involved in cell wall biosynthesis
MLIVGGASRQPAPARTPEIGRLQEVAVEEGVQHKVVFTGQRARHELKYYYSAADVFISTPWYEPFGITPLEAMACGTPVIGSRVGGIQYSVEHGKTGFLVPPNEPQALADQLAHLYHDPQMRARLGLQAIQRVQSHFTWESVAHAMAAVYEDVILAHQGGTSVGYGMPFDPKGGQDSTSRLKTGLFSKLIKTGKKAHEDAQ